MAAPVRAETGSCGRHFGIADETRFESHYVCAFICASIDMPNDRYASPKTLEKLALYRYLYAADNRREKILADRLSDRRGDISF